jgi:hypothetical protein
MMRYVISPMFPIEHYLISNDVGLPMNHAGHLEEYHNHTASTDTLNLNSHTPVELSTLTSPDQIERVSGRYSIEVGTAS